MNNLTNITPMHLIIIIVGCLIIFFCLLWAMLSACANSPAFIRAFDEYGPTPFAPTQWQQVRNKVAFAGATKVRISTAWLKQSAQGNVPLVCILLILIIIAALFI